MPLYSHSRLTSYRNCPRKFLWRYVWNVDPSVEGVEAFTGKRVHEVLERLYVDLGRGQEPPALETLLAGFHAGWEHRWGDDIRIVADEPASYYRAVGAACLEGYYRRHHPFRSGVTLAVEQPFEFVLETGRSARIRGFLDRVDVAGDGVLEVHDYKTGKRTPGAKTLEGDLQVGLYEMAARAHYPEHRRVRMVWHYLRSGVEHRLTPRDPAQMAALRHDTARRIDAIESRAKTYIGGLDNDSARALIAARERKLPSVPLAARRDTPVFPVRVGPLCRWCSYLDWCPDGARHVGVPFRPPPPASALAPAARRAEDARQLSLFDT